MNGSAALLCIKELNEGNYTALVMKNLLTKLIAASVLQNNLNARVKERLLSHSCEYGLILEYGFLKDRGVGL